MRSLVFGSRTALLAALTLASFLAVQAQPPAPTPAATGPEPLRSAGDRPIDVKNLKLELEVDLPGKTVAGRATLAFRTLRALRTLSLDAVEFEVSSVSLVVGKTPPQKVTFSHDGKQLVLDLPGLPADAEGEIVVQYKVTDPRAGLHFFGPTKAEPEVPLTVWSQGEPISNRYWIPCLDQPNVRQTTEVVATVAEGLEVLSNGALVSRKVNPDKKTATYHWRQENPHPAYLITLVVGQFDVVRDEWKERQKADKGLPVVYYVPKGRKEDVARTFGRTRAMLDFFSRRFGVRYPWEKYAQVVVEQFTHGGMENTSATTLTDRALHDERALLDSSPDPLIAHELAHQWWGDLVTCRDWSHLWLNEGFASYSEALWDEHSKGADAYAHTMLVKARQAIAGGKERPVVDRRYPNPRTMFDARSYPKGAFVLHMLRQRLGEAAFWKGVQKYGEEHRFQSVETTDLRRTLERVSGHDLERFFHDWTERPGHPVLEVNSRYEPDAKALRIHLKQTQAGEAFHFSLPIHVTTGQGTEGKPRVIVESVTQKEQRLTLPLESAPVKVEIDPALTVLAEVKEDKGRDLWLAQLTDGSTVAARVRAAEHLGRSQSPADREALAKALSGDKFWGVQTEIATALGASGGEASRAALCAGLKHEHPKVRRACAEQLAKFKSDAKAAAALKEVLSKGDPSYFVEAAALGSYAKLGQAGTVELLLPWLAKDSHGEVLRVAALEGLASTRSADALDVLISWTKRGKHRTCRASALGALAKLVGAGSLTKGQGDKAVTALKACLEGESWPIRRAAVFALRDLGPTAAPSLPSLQALVEQDPDDRVRDAAREAVTRIRTPGPAAPEVKQLREELERLKKEQEQLRDRVERAERRERKDNPRP